MWEGSARAARVSRAARLRRGKRGAQGAGRPEAGGSRKVGNETQWSRSQEGLRPQDGEAGFGEGCKAESETCVENPINVNDQEDVDIAGKESSGQPMTRARATVMTPVAQPRTWADPDTHEDTRESQHCCESGECESLSNCGWDIWVGIWGNQKM